MDTGTELTDYNVAMSNQLVRASHALSLVEKRVVAAVIALIDSRKGNQLHAHLSEFQKLRLSALDYSETYEVSTKHAYEHLKKAADALLNRQVQISHCTKVGKARYTRFNWLSSATYAETEGFIEISFTPEIYPHLNALKREYTTYKLKNAASFRSVYSWRLFELAKSWIGHCAKGKTVIITLENLREQLDVPTTYRWDHIKKRALEPAIKEIQKFNRFEISYSIIKKGRRIHSLEFLFKEDEQLSLEL